MSDAGRFAGEELPSGASDDALLAHRPQLVRYLRRKLGCLANAEDVAQETLERALKASQEVTVRHPRAFLFRIAANLIVNHVIAAKRRQATLERARDYLFADLESQSPEQEVGDRQEIVLLEQVVATLPDQTRRILYLNRCEGLSQSQIATLLGISKTAVEKHMRRAMARLSPLREG
ncbi:MAG: RNA polymerase sigma factor [Gammaproteobacteria bacterium]